VPMPHRTQMQLIKRRLVGKEGVERIRELQQILTELPDYRNGPYADIRKWVSGQIEQTRVRSKVLHRDSIGVRREGAAQIALVGPPNAGKSSLLQALSNIQIKTGDYPFTTLRPVAALTRLHGVLVQLVEIPGLIEGANDGRGGGRALLSVLRAADGIVYCHDIRAPVGELLTVLREVELAGISSPSMLAATKVDEASPGALERLRAAVPGLRVIGVSVLDDGSLEAFADVVWGLTGLRTVWTRRPGSEETDPQPVRAGETVADVAAALHGELGAECRGAHVWGPSARFPGQRVGRDHELEDGDMIEILTYTTKNHL
jgi:small GTP-binding protein